MNEDELNKLDIFLAENVMGWSNLPYVTNEPSFCVIANQVITHTDEGLICWHPTTNIAQAWEVLEKVTQPPKDLETAKRMPNTKFMLWFEKARLWAMTAQEAALEISVNAKKAWETKQ